MLWHKTFANLLNVVVIVKTNLTTQAVAHVVLFSSDLELSYDHLIDYYRLRFQLEFNFRDAKQYSHRSLIFEVHFQELEVYFVKNKGLPMLFLAQCGQVAI